MAQEARLIKGVCPQALIDLPEDSVQLIITSPPYNVGWDYGDGGEGDRRPLHEYLGWLQECLSQMYRVLKPGGVLALNLPEHINQSQDGGRGGQGHRLYPVAAHITMHLAERHGWLLREPIVWAKSSAEGKPVAASTAMGAATNPYLRATYERVILVSRSNYRVAGKTPEWEPGLPLLDATKDVWWLPGGKSKKGWPLAFPVELVTRLLRLFSSPGDVVLDPFAGWGTVGKWSIVTGRVPWLIEANPRCWSKLEAMLGQPSLL